jgi:hypothetical protein
MKKIIYIVFILKENRTYNQCIADILYRKKRKSMELPEKKGNWCIKIALFYAGIPQMPFFGVTT